MAKRATHVPSKNNFLITKVHHNRDLRTVQWSAAVLEDHVRTHRIKDNEAHVFINKNRNKSRWIVVWEGVPFLILAPTGSKLNHRVGMVVASNYAHTDEIREELRNEITELT